MSVENIFELNFLCENQKVEKMLGLYATSIPYTAKSIFPCASENFVSSCALRGPPPRPLPQDCKLLDRTRTAVQSSEVQHLHLFPPGNFRLALFHGGLQFKALLKEGSVNEIQFRRRSRDQVFPRAQVFVGLGRLNDDGGPVIHIDLGNPFGGIRMLDIDPIFHMSFLTCRSIALVTSGVFLGQQAAVILSL